MANLRGGGGGYILVHLQCSVGIIFAEFDIHSRAFKSAFTTHPPSLAEALVPPWLLLDCAAERTTNTLILFWRFKCVATNYRRGETATEVNETKDREMETIVGLFGTKTCRLFKAFNFFLSILAVDKTVVEIISISFQNYPEMLRTVDVELLPKHANESKLPV